MALPDFLKTAYDGTWNDLTFTLASLASDANLLAGRESTAVSNVTDLFDDVMVAGKVTAGTSPTAAKQIEVWAYGEGLDASTYPDVLDGTDSNETIISTDIKNAMLALAAVLPTDNTSNRTYYTPLMSLADLFGFVPVRWGFFVAHNTGVNLNATGSNHQFSYQGLHSQVTDT